MAGNSKHGEKAAARPRIGFGRYRIALPSSAPLRIALGVALVIGGILGFLPVLGFWMFPLGLLVLAVDVPPIHRFLHRLRLHWEDHTWRPWLTEQWLRAVKLFRRSKA